MELPAVAIGGLRPLLYSTPTSESSSSSLAGRGEVLSSFHVSLSNEVKRRALAAGFDLAGVAPVDVGRDLEFARAWVERGCGGEMAYLRNPKRADPRLVLPSAKSVVCVGLVYNTPLPYSTETTDPPGPRAWISRYAWGRDYHAIMRSRLETLRADIQNLAPGVETRVFVDTGPIVERAIARLSGIGWLGKNTCLIDQEKGSWFFLGVILTSLALEPDTAAFDRCGSCRRCLEACPTGALVEPYVMDASRCISYFTIELKASIPVEHRASMGANVFGCDICQDVCPWNRGTEAGAAPSSARDRREPAMTAVSEFQALTILQTRDETDAESETSRPEVRNPKPEPGEFSLFNPRLEDLASLSEEDFRRLFRDSPIKRTKYRGWLRNLCVAMGNSGDARFAPWLKEMAGHPDPVVREHAAWALGRLGGPQVA